MLKDMQMRKLQNLVTHAYNNVNYYHNLFDQAGIKPHDIRSAQDLYKIPITTKSDLQNASLKDRISKGIDINKCLNLRTSGSTGRLLDIFITEEENLKSKTMPFLYIYLENRCRLTDKTLRLTTPRFISTKKWFQRFGILREYFVSIFDDIDIQLDAFLEIKPEAIRGFSSAIKLLALEIRKRGLEISPPKMIFTTAEVINKIDRNIISSIFQADVIDYYCCNEVGIIAHECREHNGYHINEDNIIMEFIKNDGTYCKQGEEGDIVITSLNIYSMPFIRYQIGDKGLPGYKKCACGRDSSLIEVIIGRDNDHIMLPDKSVISSHFLINTIANIPGVLVYQIIQKAIDRITINIVKDNDFADELLSIRIKKACYGILDTKIKIEPLFVKEIPRDKTGKLKVVKNEINSLGSYILS